MERSRTCTHTAKHQSCIMTEAHIARNDLKAFTHLWGKPKVSFYFTCLKVQCVHVHLLYSVVCVVDPVIPYSCLPVERWAMTLFSIVYLERTCFIW